MKDRQSRMLKQRIKRLDLKKRRAIRKLEAWLTERPRLCCLVNPEFIAAWDNIKKDICEDCREVFNELHEQAYRNRLNYNYPG